MILALDPSLAYFGALLIARDLAPASALARWRITQSDPKAPGRADDDLARLRKLRVFLDELLPLCNPTSPDFALVAEQPTGSRGAGGHECPKCNGQHVPGIYRSAKAEGMVLDLVAAWAFYRGLRLHWVAPKVVKQALLGKPSGSKDEMVSAAMLCIPATLTEKRVTKPARETIADCYGVARAYALNSSPPYSSESST